MWILLIYLYSGYIGNYSVEINTQSFKTEKACLQAKYFYEQMADGNEKKIATMCLPDGVESE